MNFMRICDTDIATNWFFNKDGGKALISGSAEQLKILCGSQSPTMSFLISSVYWSVFVFDGGVWILYDMSESDIRIIMKYTTTHNQITPEFFDLIKVMLI